MNRFNRIKEYIIDLIKTLQDKYRVVLYNDSTFAEVTQLKLTGMNLFAFVGFAIIVVIGLSFLLFSYTPMKYLIPYDPNVELQQALYNNMLKLDSIETAIETRDMYLENQIRIFMGGVPIDENSDSTKAAKVDPRAFEVSDVERQFRAEIEREERSNLVVLESRENEKDIRKLHFIAPITNGVITNHFNFKDRHIAVDIVSTPDAGILSVLDGTVIEATWTLETGYIIQIQHFNDLISIYKHNSTLLKEVGEKVKAGETIAIIGNTGELTTGPHLHFELWHKGTPLNPEDYIQF